MNNPISRADNAESATTHDERRRSQRHAPSFAMAFIWVGTKQRIKARVIDESDGGIGLHVPFGTLLQVGSKIRIELGERRRWATVRHVTDMRNGCLMVGVSWDFVLI